MIVPFRTEEDVDAVAVKVADHLRAGKLLAYPTETVYGVGSDASDAGLDALARLKRRAPSKPFLLLVSGLDMLTASGLAMTPAARVLAREFWPGPLTLVLRGGEGRLPDRLRGPDGGIAVRWTSHPLLARLISAIGEPITSTSANVPGSAPSAGATGVPVIFPDAVKSGELLVLDGGVLGNVPPSTLVDCTGSVARLVREGAIPRAELRARAGSLAP
ncbi:MAG: L-threonylcarbamoyladenylate synthase [Gemmatimonadales bacterium]